MHGAMDVVISHPTKGQIPVRLCAGCPMIHRDIAMDLIQELEGNPALARMQSMADGMEAYGLWTKRMVREHPVFKNVCGDLLKPLGGSTAK